MPKFYAATGKFRNILDAPNTQTAAKLSVKKLLKEKSNAAPLIAISEKGFFSKDMILAPVIPIMKYLEADLPSDKILAKYIAKSFGTTPNKMNQSELNWLINGQMEE